MRLRFGEFVLDSDARELLRSGVRLHLSPKAYELLALLAESRPKALAKTALRERLWPKTFVVEANLSNLVGEIRAALGENSRRPQFIRTVQGFGYAFQGSDKDAAESRRGTVRFRLTWSGGQATLFEGDYVLGRDPELPICLDSATVSRRHARIRVGTGDAILEDLKSKNGTFLNGRRIEGSAQLDHGDEIRLGSLHLSIRRVGRAASTDTATR